MATTFHLMAIFSGLVQACIIYTIGFVLIKLHYYSDDLEGIEFHKKILYISLVLALIRITYLYIVELELSMLGIVGASIVLSLIGIHKIVSTL